MIKPDHLAQGDTVAIISPSAGVASVFPHIYENGLKTLENWGLKIKEFPTARADNAYLKQNPKIRADDINAAFADPEIKAIITSIGGNDGIRVLPFLDSSIIKNNSKIFMGYSDTVAFHFYLSKLGLESWHGPAIMAGFSQMDVMPEYKEHVRQFLFGKFDGTYHQYQHFNDGYPDWADPTNTGKVAEQKQTDGWHWLQGQHAEGELFGGCIELINMLNATAWWPSPDFWDGKILFFETSEEAPGLNYVEYTLRNWNMQGVFKRINGLIVGRPRDYTDDQKQKLDELLKTFVAKEAERPDLLVVSNFDIGHTDPQVILPYGRKVTLDSSQKTIQLSDL